MSNATLHRHELELQDFETTIVQAGRSVDDFAATFLPDEGFREREIRVLANAIRVTNRRTSRTHLYALDSADVMTSGGDWIVDLREDLAMGRFD